LEIDNGKHDKRQAKDSQRNGRKPVRWSFCHLNADT
jgi:hypothetical protein